MSDTTMPDHLSDPAVIVEALEALLVFGLPQDDLAAAEEREVEERGAGGLLAVVRAQREGYIARRMGEPIESCPHPDTDEVSGTRTRAAWLLGWMLRSLAELARPGDQMPLPEHVVDDQERKLARMPFYREFVEFSRRAASRKGWAALWKSAVRRYRQTMRNDPASPDFHAFVRHQLQMAMAQMFLDAGGKNRVEWPVRFNHPGLGEMVLTLERIEGKTAGVLIAEANARAEGATLVERQRCMDICTTVEPGEGSEMRRTIYERIKSGEVAPSAGT